MTPDARVLELSPTRSYSSRVVVWHTDGTGEAVRPDGEVVPCLGLLTIRLKKAQRWGAPVIQNTYAVQEAAPEQVGTRLFLVLSVTNQEQKEPYRVTVGGRHSCRCKAGTCKVPSVPDETMGCRHRDALAALIEDGALVPAGELMSV